jgi:transposase
LAKAAEAGGCKVVIYPDSTGNLGYRCCYDPFSQWSSTGVFRLCKLFILERTGLLHLSTSCRYFYYNAIADMRKGSYSLSGLLRNEMNLDVLSGDVFIFIGKRGNKTKLLQWDADGFAVYEKCLERGSFERPLANSTVSGFNETGLRTNLFGL